jgi:hypothetical protein
LISQEVAYEISRYVFGRQAEFRRRLSDDKQIQTALGLIRKAHTPQELLSLAAVDRQGGSRN